MKTVQRANKQLRVADDRLDEMRNRGFAEVDEKTGKIVAAPPKEDDAVKALKEKNAALKKENKELKEEIEAMRSKMGSTVSYRRCVNLSLGLSMNFEAVTARYVDVRLERKKEVLDAYHGAVGKADPPKGKEAEPQKGKRSAKKKSSEIDL